MSGVDFLKWWSKEQGVMLSHWHQENFPRDLVAASGDGGCQPAL